ncbi:major capsid protein [Streptomyces sp. NPDC005568]
MAGNLTRQVRAMMEFGKGVEIEAQSNPIHLCTRPKALIKLKA